MQELILTVLLATPQNAGSWISPLSTNKGQGFYKTNDSWSPTQVQNILNHTVLYQRLLAYTVPGEIHFSPRYCRDFRPAQKELRNLEWMPQSLLLKKSQSSTFSALISLTVSQHLYHLNNILTTLDLMLDHYHLRALLNSHSFLDTGNLMYELRPLCGISLTGSAGLASVHARNYINQHFRRNGNRPQGCQYSWCVRDNRRMMFLARM